MLFYSYITAFFDGFQISVWLTQHLTCFAFFETCKKTEKLI